MNKPGGFSILDSRFSIFEARLRMSRANRFPHKKGEFPFFRLSVQRADRGSMSEKEMKERTRVFAIQILDLIDAIPDTRSGRIIAGQLGRSGTSVGSNYRAA